MKHCESIVVNFPDWHQSIYTKHPNEHSHIEESPFIIHFYISVIPSRSTSKNSINYYLWYSLIQVLLIWKLCFLWLNGTLTLTKSIYCCSNFVSVCSYFFRMCVFFYTLLALCDICPSLISPNLFGMENISPVD